MHAPQPLSQLAVTEKQLDAKKEEKMEAITKKEQPSATILPKSEGNKEVQQLIKAPKPLSAASPIPEKKSQQSLVQSKLQEKLGEEADDYDQADAFDEYDQIGSEDEGEGGEKIIGETTADSTDNLQVDEQGVKAKGSEIADDFDFRS